MKKKLDFHVQLISCDIPGLSRAGLLTRAGNTFFHLGTMRYLVSCDPQGILAESNREIFSEKRELVVRDCMLLASYSPSKVIDYFSYADGKRSPLSRIVLTDYELVLEQAKKSRR